MVELKIINRCTKDHKCTECGRTISKGSKYYKIIDGSKYIAIRCDKCKLSSSILPQDSWELPISKIINNWKVDFGVQDSAIDNIVQQLINIIDNYQELLDNLPENLNYTDTINLIQSRIYLCIKCINKLININFDWVQEYTVVERFSSLKRRKGKSVHEILCSLNDSEREELNNLVNKEFADVVDKGLMIIR